MLVIASKCSFNKINNLRPFPLYSIFSALPQVMNTIESEPQQGVEEEAEVCMYIKEKIKKKFNTIEPPPKRGEK